MNGSTPKIRIPITLLLITFVSDVERDVMSFKEFYLEKYIGFQKDELPKHIAMLVQPEKIDLYKNPSSSEFDAAMEKAPYKQVRIFKTVDKGDWYIWPANQTVHHIVDYFLFGPGTGFEHRTDYNLIIEKTSDGLRVGSDIREPYDSVWDALLKDPGFNRMVKGKKIETKQRIKVKT